MKRFGMICLGVFLFLGTVELGMRIQGWLFLSAQERGNTLRPEESRLLRIVAIGDSTTADYFLSSGQVWTWPRQLERMLRENGIPARVYNLARPGANTSFLLSRISGQLDRIRPHIAISMMGFADVNVLLVPESDWIGGLRVVKLYRLLRTKFRAWRRPPQQTTWDFGDPKETKEIVARLKMGYGTSALPLIERHTEKLDPATAGRYLFQLAREVDPELSSRRSEFYSVRLNLMKQSLSLNFDDAEVVHSLAYLLAVVRNEDECLALAKKVADKPRLANEEVVNAFCDCASNTQRSDEWAEVIGKLTGGRMAAHFMRREEVLRRNYRELYYILASRGVRHVAMQYPNLDVAELESYFKPLAPGGKIEPEFREITFVENRKNFEAALAKHRFEDLFVDRMAIKFGHTTELGYSEITKAVYPAVTKVVERLRSR